MPDFQMLFWTNLISGPTGGGGGTVENHAERHRGGCLYAREPLLRTVSKAASLEQSAFGI